MDLNAAAGAAGAILKLRTGARGCRRRPGDRHLHSGLNPRSQPPLHARARCAGAVRQRIGSIVFQSGHSGASRPSPRALVSTSLAPLGSGVQPRGSSPWLHFLTIRRPAVSAGFDDGGLETRQIGKSCSLPGLPTVTGRPHASPTPPRPRRRSPHPPSGQAARSARPHRRPETRSGAGIAPQVARRFSPQARCPRGP